MSVRYKQRKRRNWWLIALLSVLVAVSTFLIGVLIGALSTSEEVASPSESATQTIAATEPTVPTAATAPATMPTQPTEAATEEATEPVTEPPTLPQQPDMLTALLDSHSIRYEELEQMGCHQLIAVTASGNKAQIRFFTCQDGAWTELPELDCQGYVGWNGVSAEKQEGDGCTPSGLHGIGSAFYITNLPDTKLDVFQVTDDTYWVDDPNSVFYNQRVEGTQNKDWNSAEHMIRYEEYRYGFVVDYNLQAEKGAGSAIFFHIGGNSTAGCVATEENMVLSYLKELDKAENPHILIIDVDTL